MSKKHTKSPGRRRNLLHDAPLLRKCAVHAKTNKAKRRKDKVAMTKDWFFPWALIRVPMEKISLHPLMG